MTDLPPGTSPPTGMVAMRRTGLFGQIIKWLFVVFNVLMFIWLVHYWSQLSTMSAPSATESVGKAIGGTLGTGVLLVVWLIGAGMLGLLVMLTRGPVEIVPIGTGRDSSRYRHRRRFVLATVAIIALVWLTLPKETTVPAAQSSSSVPAVIKQGPQAQSAPAIGATRTYSVDVSGSINTRFSGTCMIVGSAGSTRTADIGGTVPRRFEFSGSMISCTAQNQENRGSIRLVITRDRNYVVSDSIATQPYGVAAASGH